jgi:hypothetical protein
MDRFQTVKLVWLSLHLDFISISRQRGRMTSHPQALPEPHAMTAQGFQKTYTRYPLIFRGLTRTP